MENTKELNEELQRLEEAQKSQQNYKSEILTRSEKLQPRENKKGEKSHDFFKGTKTDSCSYVVVKGGVAQAVPYYAKPKQTYADKMQRNTYKVHQNLHIGLGKKPLEPYNPTSYRNRLPIVDCKLPRNNSSSIEIGNRSMFVSQTRNAYGNFGVVNPVTNSGILAERTKWHHSRQNK